MYPIRDPGKLRPMPPPPPRPMEMYCPTGEATIISPDFSAVRRSMTAPCPAKIPRVGKVTAVVKPAPRAVSMRRSVLLTSSAILTQLVVWGRSSGPRAGMAAAWGAAGAGVGGGAGGVSRPTRPGGVGGAILRPAGGNGGGLGRGGRGCGGGCGGGSASAAAGGCGGGRGRGAGLSPSAQGVDQAGIDGETFALD